MSEPLVDDLSETSIRFIVETVRDALRNDGPTAQPGLVRLPEDERLRAIVGDILERKLASFEKRVEAIVACRDRAVRCAESACVSTTRTSIRRPRISAR